MNFKQISAKKAVEFIENDMVVGLGTGSTVYYALIEICKLIEKGLKIVGIPTSIETEKLAKQLKILICDLNEYETIDITIDGADEVDTKLNLIKGKGGALLREKIIAKNTKKEIIIVDESKLVDVLGKKTPLPVEIVTFSYKAIIRSLREFGCVPYLRLQNNNEIYLTDNNNYIVDCKFSEIDAPTELAKEINNLPGVVENGLFVDLADIVIVSAETGTKIIEKKDVKNID